MYINIFQKLRVLRDKFDRQNNYTRVPHFPVIIPDDFPHIFFFPVLSSLKIIAIRYELSTRVDRRGKERRGRGRWEGKGKARRTMNARLCISTSTSMARIMHLTEVSIGSRFLPFISFYIVLLVSSTDTSTFTYPRGRVWPASRSSEYRFRLFLASLLSNRAALQFLQSYIVSLPLRKGKFGESFYFFPDRYK